MHNRRSAVYSESGSYTCSRCSAGEQCRLGGAAFFGVGGVLADPVERLGDAREHVRDVGDGARAAERDHADLTVTAIIVHHERSAAVAVADALAARGPPAGAYHVAPDDDDVVPDLSALVLGHDGQVHLLQGGGLRLTCAQQAEAAGGGRLPNVCLTGLGQADRRDGVCEVDIAVQLQQREVPAALDGVRVTRVVDDPLHIVALLADVGCADPVVAEEDLEAAGLAEVPLRAVCRRQHVPIVDDAATAEGGGATDPYESRLPGVLTDIRLRSADDPAGLTLSAEAVLRGWSGCSGRGCGVGSGVGGGGAGTRLRNSDLAVEGVPSPSGSEYE